MWLEKDQIINCKFSVMKENILKRFLTKTEDSGRFIVISKITGITYFVEPIDNGKPAILWGDQDPVTKKLTGDYGSKRRGAVEAKDSLITPENGFVKISTFKGSPLGEIDRRDRLYEQERSKK
jgi:ribosomal protein L10